MATPNPRHGHPVPGDWGARYAARVGNQLADLLTEVEAIVIRQIRDQIAADRGASIQDVHRAVRLAGQRVKLHALLGREYSSIIREIERLVTDAVWAGQGQALHALNAPGTGEEYAPQVQLLAQKIAADTLNHFYGFPVVILRQAADEYQKIIAAKALATATGNTTRKDATQAALDDFARRGITGFTDKAGREWRIDSYAEMAVRTGTLHGLREGYLQTLTLYGQDLVAVSTTGYTCPSCALWQGKILSITGATPIGVQIMESAITPGRGVPVEVAGTVEQARADGLFHPNCGHSLALYQPGVTRLPADPDPLPEVYEASQQQRALERDIRALKRKLAAQLDPVAGKEIEQKIRARQSAIRALIREHPQLARKRQREQIKTAH